MCTGVLWSMTWRKWLLHHLSLALDNVLLHIKHIKRRIETHKCFFGWKLLLYMETRIIEGHWIQLIDTHCVFTWSFNFCSSTGQWPLEKHINQVVRKRRFGMIALVAQCTLLPTLSSVTLGIWHFFADVYLSDSLCAVQCEFLALWNSLLVLWFASLHEKPWL